jgi:hypothetical protein
MLMYMLLAVLEVFVQQYVLMGADEATLLKDVASTHTGSIFVSLLVFFVCVRLILVQ